MNIESLIDQIIDLALIEDGEDVTSNACFAEEDNLDGIIRVKENGIVAGLEIGQRVLRHLDAKIEFKSDFKDGDAVKVGDIVARIHGPARQVLKGERVVLNFMQRMSGIATTTATYVKEVEGTKCRILDTRKTLPGLRYLDKMAVTFGGGTNHRLGLYDMAMLKDNHVDRVGSITEAVSRIRKTSPGIPIEVEARSVEDVRELLKLDVDRIMLDNFSLEMMREAVELVGGKVELEASGGITLETIHDVALTGVDFISVGALTHSVKALDLSMILEESNA